MASLTKNKTYEDYLQTPEGSKFQLIDGEIIEMTSPSSFHQTICYRLTLKIGNFIESRKSGKLFPAPMDVTFNLKDTVQPDLLFIAKPNYSIIGEKRINGAPDLIIEVLSPSTAYLDLKYKKDLYENSSVKEYWILDPEGRSIEIYFNENNNFTRIQKIQNSGQIKSKLLEGFEVNVQEIFDTEN